MTEYREIKTEADAEAFIKETNGLHDGYVIDLQYKNDGIEIVDGGYDFYTDRSELRMKVLVTSIMDTIVEMIFSGVDEWRVCSGTQDILDSYISFPSDETIIWADSDSDYEEYAPCRVMARSMRWRKIEF